MPDPGTRIVLHLIEGEQERGTDGVVIYDEELDLVTYRMLSEFVNDEEQREEVADLLSDEDGHGQAIVIVRRSDGVRQLWYIPKRLIAEMSRTTSAILLDQDEIPVWETLKRAGRLVASS